MNFNTDLDKRTKTLVKNIGLSSVYRVLNICITFISVPLLIDLLGTRDYGVWVAISSILAWVNFFDFGITISLQNRIARTIALGRFREAKVILSSTYALVTLIITIIIVLIIALTRYVNWSILLNISIEHVPIIRTCIILIAISIASQLVLKLANAVIFAYQKTNIIELINLIIQSAMLAAILALSNSKLSGNPLVYVSLIYCFIPVLTFFLVNIIAFRWSFRKVSPSIEYISLAQFKTILTNSSSFLFMQLYGLVLFQTDNIIVANLFSPAYVTTFSIISKYFSLITIAFGIILMPYWSATSEALALGDFKWLRKTLNHNLVLLLGLSVLAGIMAAFSRQLIPLWTKEVNEIPPSLAVSMALYTIILAYNNIFGIILNAANIFRIQIILVTIIILINVPLSYFLVLSTNLGMTGIVTANLVCVSIFGLFVTLQVNKFLRGSAKGIWIR